MSNFTQIDSISISNSIQLNFSKKGIFSGVESDGVKGQTKFLGRGRRPYLVRVFLSESCDWLKCREEFDCLAFSE